MILHQRPLRNVCDTQSLTICTLFTPGIIPWYTKHPVIFVFFSIEKKIIMPALTVPRLSHLTSYTPTKSNSYLANSLAADLSEPVLYRLLTFQVPNLISLFRCLGRTKVSVQVRCFLCEHFVTRFVLRWGVVSTSSYPQVGGPPATAYWIYSELLSITETVPPSATWGRARPRQRRPFYHEEFVFIQKKKNGLTHRTRWMARTCCNMAVTGSKISRRRVICFIRSKLPENAEISN
jgi:hypothetical protein